MSPAPRLRPRPPDPSLGLRTHSAVLRAHAERLRAAAEELGGRAPQGDALRAEVNALADRCTTAANGFALAAAQLEAGRRRR
ncbi:hypothetical protein ABZ128_04700 [Streptomyces sp. NPDC006326]|uniref:hypothetical protein n=1 Tax=Streptomyces sp. NPDC006326 TaxID=3156752 RepID=UPI0033B25F4E